MSKSWDKIRFEVLRKSLPTEVSDEYIISFIFLCKSICRSTITEHNKYNKKDF